jgi:4-hydroxy-4-methyl-2-oxoglutarate aldolase
MSIVVRNVPRPDPDLIEGFRALGVASVHEAQGRTGLLAATRDREAKEVERRRRLRAGELGLDISGSREALAAKGLRYVDYPASS